MLKQFVTEAANYHLQDYVPCILHNVFASSFKGLACLIQEYCYDEYEFERHILQKLRDLILLSANPMMAPFELIGALPNDWLQDVAPVAQGWLHSIWRLSYCLYGHLGGSINYYWTQAFKYVLTQYDGICVRPSCALRVPSTCICSRPVIFDWTAASRL